MPNINVKAGVRTFTIYCEEFEKGKTQIAADEFNKEIEKWSKEESQSNTHTIVMAALGMTSRLLETMDELNVLKTEHQSLSKETVKDTDLADEINNIRMRMEDLTCQVVSLNNMTIKSSKNGTSKNFQ